MRQHVLNKKTKLHLYKKVKITLDYLKNPKPIIKHKKTIIITLKIKGKIQTNNKMINR